MASEHEDIALVLQGYLDRQEWDKAIAELVKLTHRSPRNLNLHLRLAHLYWRVGDTDQALERFHHCAEGFYKQGSHKEALAAATSMLKIQPDSQFALELVRKVREKSDFIQQPVSEALKEDLLASLPAEALEDLASCLQLSVYPEGATIVKERDPGFHLFLIRRGEVEVFLTDRDGKRFKIAELREGDFFGEISLAKGGPRTATVVATRPSDCWVLGKPDFDRFITRYPRFKEVIDQCTRERIKDTQRCIRTHGIERRVFPRIPVDLEVHANLVDEQGNIIAMGAMVCVFKDLSLSGARLRVPVADRQQRYRLCPGQQVRVKFALTASVSMSLACRVECVQPREEGLQVYAEYGLSFGELSQADKKEINKFIAGQLVS